MTYLEEHYNEIFKKYTTAELIKDIQSYQFGEGNLTKTLNHFFKEIIFSSAGKKSNISPWDALSNIETTKRIIEYTKSKPNFFTSTNEVANVESALRNSFSWCRKVANFPPKEARKIYFRYHDINGKTINCLDTSMGFGSRMSAVLLKCKWNCNLWLKRKCASINVCTNVRYIINTLPSTYS